jgi:hypothetical protein
VQTPFRTRIVAAEARGRGSGVSQKLPWQPLIAIWLGVARTRSAAQSECAVWPASRSLTPDPCLRYRHFRIEIYSLNFV